MKYREAAYYQPIENEQVRCLLCPHRCVISSGKTGICGVRRNRAGRLLAETYGHCASFAVDPMEKKPLYHFHPGMLIFSVGSRGCNLSCRFCQNHSLAHGQPDTHYLSPRDLVASVLSRAPESIGIAFTYNEPLVSFEFLLEASAEAAQNNLKTVVVSNGYINNEPLQKLLPLVNAFNIDLKGYSQEYYQKFTGGKLEQVKRNIISAKNTGCHVEVTTLLIPGENDDPQEIERMAAWLAAEAGRDVPLHLSRYFPAHKLDSPPTPLKTMEQAYHAALKQLDFVYLGNAPELDKSSTSCPRCNTLIISRSWGKVTIENLNEDSCAVCGKELSIVS
ncbi:AmmeMemoRadiSam system radical SAM enzyme [Metallumcola ferriviriculae]|uniref:AmmeMemoRadiSam system radical SAM enzyme n=1 Tax=Metallumcola ferriviriculae TaxID=3039180 RepID=A0AAU0UJK0_9FIRM|nr:AmmeMemoRadiSam system radical SAM enzyme [Desulfitibacteraceae bacterium MK1]